MDATTTQAGFKRDALDALANRLSDADVIRTVYYPRDDLFVGFVSADSKSRATIVHPMCGAMVVRCSDLQEI